MKAVAFTDLHGNIGALNRIIRASKNADIILCSGDLTNFQQGLIGMLRKLERTGKRVVIIPGNHESPGYLKEVSRRFPKIKDVHKSGCIIGELLIIGYGSGGFLQREPDFPCAAEKFSEMIKKHPEKKVVMLTHAPPYGTMLDKIGREHRGSRDISEFIKKHRVELLLCGHFHENAGIIEKIGRTTIINPGTFLEMEIK